MSDFVVIDGINDAKNLIYATWLRSYQVSSLQAKHIKRDLFFAEHHKVLDSIFARNPHVRLAVLPDDPSVVLGWSVVERADDTDVVHYVYVKPSFRRYGIAKALLSDVQIPFVFTHSTYGLRDLHPRLEKCEFNPYRVTA